MTRRLAVAGACAGIVVALAGCGTGGPAESETAGQGQALFQQKCAGCHALAAAGARGQIGPNLDNAFAAAKEEGFGEDAIRDVVLGQMRYPIPPMPEPEDPRMFPPDKFTDAEREQALGEIAAYVAGVSGTGEQVASAAGNAKDPKAIFTANCGSCHVFKPAGTQGQVGPGLDETQMTVAAIEKQIRNGGGGMPGFAGQLSNDQISALAKYIYDKGSKG